MQENQPFIISDAQLIELGMRGKRLDINRKVFKKTPQEKVVLKKVRTSHNRMLRNAGINPKHQMNIFPSQLIKA